MAPEQVERFALAGRATFTLLNPLTGNRRTYRVARSKDGRVHFVSVLVGPDNTSNYGYIGFIRGGAFRHGGAKAVAGSDSVAVRAFDWFWRHRRALAETPVEVWHEGRCGRCGRALTVPESIQTGLGPECAGRVQ